MATSSCGAQNKEQNASRAHSFMRFSAGAQKISLGGIIRTSAGFTRFDLASPGFTFF